MYIVTVLTLRDSWAHNTLRRGRKQPSLWWPPWVAVKRLFVVVIVIVGVVVTFWSLVLRVTVLIPVNIRKNPEETVEFVILYKPLCMFSILRQLHIQLPKRVIPVPWEHTVVFIELLPAVILPRKTVFIELLLPADGGVVCVYSVWPDEKVSAQGSPGRARCCCSVA